MYLHMHHLWQCNKYLSLQIVLSAKDSVVQLSKKTSYILSITARLNDRSESNELQKAIALDVTHAVIEIVVVIIAHLRLNTSGYCTKACNQIPTLLHLLYDTSQLHQLCPNLHLLMCLNMHSLLLLLLKTDNPFLHLYHLNLVRNPNKDGLRAYFKHLLPGFPDNFAILKTQIYLLWLYVKKFLKLNQIYLP